MTVTSYAGLSLPSTITDSIEFLQDLPLYKYEKPFFSNIPFFNVPGAKQHNISMHIQPNIPVYDIRGFEDHFKLNRYGFELKRTLKVPPPTIDLFDDTWVQKDYYAMVTAFLVKELKAESVLVYDHVVRNHDPKMPRYKRGTKGERQPSFSVHCDSTYAASAQRFAYHLGLSAEELAQKRGQIINVWRPLFGPIQDYPLCFCDPETVDKENDLVATDLVYPHYLGEQWHTKYNPNQKYYYLSDQMPDETWIFKCFDSRDDGVARFVPHTSFDLAIPGARLRESIEFRCLVLGPKYDAEQ